MILHILTAVSRPENMETIDESIGVAAANAPDVHVKWHWQKDLERQHVGGQAVKNAMLDKIEDGWVWVLDDDTVAHESVLRVVTGLITIRTRNAVRPVMRAVIVGQQRTDGRVLVAAPENVVPGSVDIGQAFLRRDLIGDHRIPESYNGDGEFLQAVLADAKPGAVTYMGDVLSLHNALSGVEVSM